MIKKLNYEEFKGKKYSITIPSNQYLDIKRVKEGFSLTWVKTSTNERVLEDTMLSDWLDNPIAYGYYENLDILGFVEGFYEEWNNRFRISNIIVFDEGLRGKGIGKMLLEKILEDAKASKARMVVLETQSYNHNAISFYKRNGFDIIGFDLYAYSNEDLKNHNVRIEMGKKLS